MNDAKLPMLRLLTEDFGGNTRFGDGLVVGEIVGGIVGGADGAHGKFL